MWNTDKLVADAGGAVELTRLANKGAAPLTVSKSAVRNWIVRKSIPSFWLAAIFIGARAEGRLLKPEDYLMENPF